MIDFLKENDWTIIGGEPPDGTSDLMPRIAIRDNSVSGRSHSKNTQKVDIMAFKNNTLLLVELKPSFDKSDKRKLDLLTTKRRNDLLDAIEERTSIKRHNISQIYKGLGFSVGSKFVQPEDYVIFLVSKEEKVKVSKAKNIITNEL